MPRKQGVPGSVAFMASNIWGVIRTVRRSSSINVSFMSAAAGSAKESPNIVIYVIQFLISGGGTGLLYL